MLVFIVSFEGAEGSKIWRWSAGSERTMMILSDRAEGDGSMLDEIWS